MKILKFGAAWCSSCLIMKPIWTEIEKELSWLNTEYFDADFSQELIHKYSISDYPCFIFLDKENKEIHREYGEIEKNKLIDIIMSYKDK